MADSNLAQLSYLVEDTYNEAPNSGDELQILRYTSESLSFDITNISSQEIRPDRATADLVQTGAATLTSSNTASSISSAATTTFVNVSVGQWLKITGLGTATTVGYFRVTSLSESPATTITVFPAPVANAATSCSVRGSVIRNGITEKSFAFERKIVVNSTTATNVFFQYSGMIANSMALSAKSDAILTGSFEFMGAAPGVSDDTAFSTTIASQTTTQVLNATSNVGGVYEGYPTFALIANCLIQGIDISLNNNLRAIKGIGSIYACDVGVGQCDVSGTLNAYFFDKAMYAKYIAGTETAISFRTIDASGNGYVFTLPRIKFETDKVNVGGSNQDVMDNITFKALHDSTTDCQIQIDRF